MSKQRKLERRYFLTYIVISKLSYGIYKVFNMVLALEVETFFPTAGRNLRLFPSPYDEAMNIFRFFQTPLKL